MQTEPRDSTRSGRALRNIALASTAGLVLASSALIVARRPVAGWLVESYLAGQGIAASVQIDSLGFAGASARLRLGDASAPELSVEKIAVSFAWQGWSPHIAAIVLVRPVVRLRYDGNRLSLGVLQKLMDTPAAPPAVPPATPRSAKPAPQRELPAVAVEGARLHVVTPHGTMEAIASGRFAGGQLTQLDATLRPARIRLHGLSADIQSAHIWTNTPGQLHAAIRGDLSSSGAEKSIAARSSALELEAQGLRLHELADGGISVSGQIEARFAAGALSTGAITLDDVRAHIAGTGRADTAGGMDIITALTAEAGMSAEEARAQAASIPVLGSDPPSGRALAAALRHFTLRIVSMHVQRANGETSVTLQAPGTVTSDNGALITLAPRNEALFHAAAGGWRGAGDLTLRGGQLPAITLAVSNYAWTKTANGNAAFDASAHIEAKADLARARGVSLTADGDMSLRNGEFRLALDRCADVQITSLLQKRSPVLNDGHARVCSQPGQAIFATRPGGWNLQATWNQLSVRLPSAQALAANARGKIALESSAGPASGTIDFAGLRLSDRARTRRFAPLTATGRLTLANNVWRGRVALAGVKQSRLGVVTLTHAMQSGRGRADIRLDGIAFSPGKGQPGDLSPLLAPLARAEGKASFTGQAAWTARRMTSSGDLVFQKLDFVSPLGQVHGAEGRVHFVSLAPLHTAPGQTVQATKIDWSTPLSGISATFELTPAAFMLSDAHAGMATGQVSLGPVNLALLPDHVTEGEIRIQDIDIGMLVAASNLSKKITLTARVSGNVPFRYGPEGLRFVAGRISTQGQGRLSIARSLWSEGEDQGSNAVRSFAYQAMEDLAIDKLDGTINSLPNGRLGMIFRVKGRYDPKKAGEQTVDLIELLQGKALDKSIPLPKGTDVNLTLDTTLNFDELLAAYRKAWADTHAKD